MTNNELESILGEEQEITEIDKDKSHPKIKFIVGFILFLGVVALVILIGMSRFG